MHVAVPGTTGAAAPTADGSAAGVADTAAAAAAAAADTAAAAAAASHKRVLTDSQRENLAKKPCQACGRDLPPRSKKCPDCGAEQQLKTEAELAELLQPLEPYTGSGALPAAQDSTQAMANVAKRLQKPALLKQVSTGVVVGGTTGWWWEGGVSCKMRTLKLWNSTQSIQIPRHV